MDRWDSADQRSPKPLQESAARHISTQQELLEFVKLWSMLKNVSLRRQEDTVFWKWEQSGEYSVASAYKIQF
jgi:hypothetical protein